MMFRVAVTFLIIATLAGFASARQEQPVAEAQVAAPEVAEAPVAEAEAEAEPAPPAHRGEFLSVKLEQEPAESNWAWETRPYQVAVWVCLDGSPMLINSEQEICRRIETNSQLLDPGGWSVVAGTPPSQWRWKLLQSSIDPTVVEQVLADPELEFYDKLMVVRVNTNGSSYDIDVREIDVRTRQVGPTVTATTGIHSLTGSIASRLVARAFMPIARIDQVGKTNKAEMRARGIESCVRTEINEELQPEVVAIKNSPCFIRDTDRLLPVVVRTDRGGAVVKLDAIPLTFIAIESIEGTVIGGQVFSAVRVGHSSCRWFDGPATSLARR